MGTKSFSTIKREGEHFIRLGINYIIQSLLFCVPRKDLQKAVLVIKIDALGDFVIFVPSLVRYRSVFPEKKITLLVSSRINKEIASRLIGSYVDEILLIDDKRFAKNFFYRLLFSLKLYREHFETVIYPVYFRRFIGDFLTKVVKANHVIGFAGYRIQEDDDRSFSDHYTTLITLPPEITNEFYKHKYLLEQLSPNTIFDAYEPFFPLQKEDKENAQKLLRTHGVPSTYAVVFPGSGSPIRNWPVEKFKEIIEHLHTLDTHVVLCGSKEESLIAKKIISLFENTSSITDLSGSTSSIFQLAAIIEQSKLYIGGDTGPTHISAAVGAPTVCLMGGGVFMEFFPYGNLDKNRVVYDKSMTCMNDNWKCSENNPFGAPAPCIENIKPKDVINEINSLLKEQQ
jgi:ADP-heptose:LPS heptosyltransferase